MSKFYLTTAINYTNGSPHIGHAYEAILGDCLVRWHRLLGENVFFLTGTDEHGQKISETAKKINLTPIELCNKYVSEFQSLDDKINISYDFFVRTTLNSHKENALFMWNLCLNSGDIYLGEYEGWYSTREEKYYSLTEAKKMNYLDKDVPLIQIKEESYLFRLSKYQNKIIEHIKTHPEFILPEDKANEILERLKEPLLDLSISRKNCDWGIKIPNSDHVMYVWFDALTNYLSGRDYWPANIHLIGKDILWFHAVIWSAMLFSAGLPLPKTILCHGFINDTEGKKMSKSWGNVIDPVLMINKYKSDPFRYYLLREGSFGQDLSFNENSLKLRYQTELADNLGNLFQRGIRLTELYSKGVVPVELSLEPIFNISKLILEINELFNSYQISKAVSLIFDTSKHVNKWLATEAPWKIKDEQKQLQIIRTLLESLYILAHLVEPILPDTHIEMLKRLNHQHLTLDTLVEGGWATLIPGTSIYSGVQLFPRL